MRDGHRARAATGLLVVAFALCIVLANWAILHVGADNGTGHPRTIPVGFGLDAPSGVLFAGVLFTLRDILHERVGTGRTLVIIVATAPLTAVTSAPSLALASVVTFLVAEIADLAVYARIRRHGRTVAVLASNVVSSFVDSAVFLTLAFGGAPDVRTVVAMTFGKFAMSAVTLGAITLAVRARDARPAPEMLPAERTHEDGRVAR
ncbi:VUT family protein [Cellulomonas cellasea]|uniref:VUT family protein n=1 Tax=Cellulomonas cellasea TaxID=43670 RepID=A0A7W4UH94_9CELL|nr:VUT family protein [Cellulomonas cellasea]MBB2924120.1 hypothetical protein [Cellulomonas cellasea]